MTSSKKCNCESCSGCFSGCFSVIAISVEQRCIFSSCYCCGRNIFYEDEDLWTLEREPRRCSLLNLLCCCWLSRCCCDCVDTKRSRLEPIADGTLYFCPPPPKNYPNTFTYTRPPDCGSEKCNYNCLNPLCEYHYYGSGEDYDYNFAGNDKCCCFFTYYPENSQKKLRFWEFFKNSFPSCEFILTFRKVKKEFSFHQKKIDRNDLHPV